MCAARISSAGPIVCTPDEAGHCLLHTKLDVPAIDNFLVEKEYSLQG